MTIKLEDGKIAIKDGKVSCECCATTCSGSPDSTTSTVLLSARDYAASYAGGVLSATLGHTINMTSSSNGASVRMAGTIIVSVVVDMPLDQCVRDPLQPSGQVLFDSVNCTVISSPAGPYTLTQSDCVKTSLSITAIAFRLNNASGEPYLYLRFGASRPYGYQYTWTSTDPANFPNVSLSQVENPRFLTGTAIPGTASTMTLMLDAASYAVPIQIGQPITPNNTNSAWDPIQLNFQSYGP